jgi:RNA polymerase sigma factor (sigma-70 family)
MDPVEPMGDDTRRFLEQHFPGAYLDELKAMAHALAGRKAGQVDPSGLVVDAMLRAARKHRQLKELGNLKAWFRTILVREVLAKLQLECHRRTQEFGDDHLRQLPQPGEEGDLLERDEEKSWAKAYLWKLLSRLSEDDQAVICLSRLKGLPDADVAELLGINETALRQRRSRAVRRLQTLAQQFPDG